MEKTIHTSSSNDYSLHGAMASKHANVGYYGSEAVVAVGGAGGGVGTASDMYQNIDLSPSPRGRNGTPDELFVVADGKPTLKERLVELFRELIKPHSIILYLCTLAIVICYADRSNISIAILKMKDSAEWSETEKGFILASFFVGYIATQVFGGWLSYRYGGGWVLNVGVLVWSLFTALTPLSVVFGLPALLMCRILMGAGEGVSFPAIHQMTADWIPEHQRSRAVAIFTSGSAAGAVIASALAPWIIIAISWQAVFYIFGFVGVVWCVLYGAFTYRLPHPTFRSHSPSASPLLVASPSESNLSLRDHDALVNATKNSAEDGQSNDIDLGEHHRVRCGKKEKPGCIFMPWRLLMQSTNNCKSCAAIPWGIILTNKQVWAIIINQFCNSWAYYVLLAWTPTYFQDVHNEDLASISIFASIPYLAYGVMGISVGFLSDFILMHFKLRVCTLRIIMQVIGMVGPAICLVGIVYWAQTSIEAMVWLTLGLGLNTATLVGVSVLHLDIESREFAGLVFALGNTSGNIGGLIAIPVTGWMQPHWELIFWLGAALLIFGALLWMVLVDGEPLFPPTTEATDRDGDRETAQYIG